MEIRCNDWTIHLTAEPLPWYAADRDREPPLTRVRLRCIPDARLTGRQMLGAEHAFYRQESPQAVLMALALAFRDAADCLERASWHDEHAIAAVNPMRREPA